MMDAPTAIDHGTCGCGNPAEKISSGTPECWKCWNVRKHLLAEAKFWTKGIDGLFENEHGTGPDPNDLMLWNRWGMQESVLQALYTLKALGQAYHEILDNPRPWAKERLAKASPKALAALTIGAADADEPIQDPEMGGWEPRS